MHVVDRKTFHAELFKDGQIGWRYIVTAPKNGTRVLAWCHQWSAPCTAEFNGYKEWCVHGSPFKYQPTHWMPLPKPPSDSGSGPTGEDTVGG